MHLGDLIIKGMYVGAMVALPVGPIAIMLSQTTLLVRGWSHWPITSFLAGFVLFVHNMVALTAARLITVAIEEYPVEVYLFMGVLVCGISLRFYRLNKKIDFSTPKKAREGVGSIYEPALVCLMCPVNAFLLLNVFAGDPSLRATTSLSDSLILSLAAGTGAGLTYVIEMTALHLCLAKTSMRIVKLFARLAPFIILIYAMKSFWIAWEAWR